MSQTSIDQQFVEFIVKSLVGKPEAVSVTRTIDEKGVLLELFVDPEDIGRVIGKRGSTAQSLRALLRALGTKNDARYNLKIVDVDKPEGERGSDRSERRSEASEEVVAEETAPVEEQTESSWKASVSGVFDEDEDNLTDKPVDKEDDRVSRARKELADLDDLDI